MLRSGLPSMFASDVMAKCCEVCGADSDATDFYPDANAWLCSDHAREYDEDPEELALRRAPHLMSFCTAE